MVWKYACRKETAVPLTTELKTPSLAVAADAIIQIEKLYEVSLKFWISFNEAAYMGGYFEVFVVGSGTIFDRMPPELCVCRSRIISAFDDPFAESLCSALHSMERGLSRYK